MTESIYISPECLIDKHREYVAPTTPIYLKGDQAQLLEKREFCAGVLALNSLIVDMH